MIVGKCTASSDTDTPTNHDQTSIYRQVLSSTAILGLTWRAYAGPNLVPARLSEGLHFMVIIGAAVIEYRAWPRDSSKSVLHSFVALPVLFLSSVCYGDLCRELRILEII